MHETSRAELVVGGHRLEHVWHGPGPGDAPTLVFLHEGLGSVSLWRDFPRRLAEATGCGALVYSRAGYGRSDPAPPPWSVRYMHEEAAVLEEVLDQAGVSEAVLVGHSDGGSIALIHAGSHPGGRVRGLVLLAPHVFVEEIGLSSIAGARDQFRTGDLRRALERHHGSNVDGAFWGWNGVWLDPAFRSWNIEEFLPRIQVPVLVVQGADDPYGTLRQVDAIESGCAGPVERLVLAQCAHAPHREQPERTLEAAAAFLTRCRLVRGLPRRPVRRAGLLGWLPMERLTKADIRQALQALAAALPPDAAVAELWVVGGAAMVLLYEARETTKDVDAFTIDTTGAPALRAAAADVASRLALPADWLNDGAKGYLNGLAPGELLFSHPRLVARSVAAHQLLAMKLSAWRDDLDVADARLLLSKIPGDRESVWKQVGRHLVPGRELKAQYAFDDLWEADRGPA